jgi:hypothetical protein
MLRITSDRCSLETFRLGCISPSLASLGHGDQFASRNVYALLDIYLHLCVASIRLLSEKCF